MPGVPGECKRYKKMRENITDFPQIRGGGGGGGGGGQLALHIRYLYLLIGSETHLISYYELAMHHLSDSFRIPARLSH